MKYKLEVRIIITEAETKGYSANPYNRLELTDSISISSDTMLEMMKQISNIHEFIKMQEYNLENKK